MEWKPLANTVSAIISLILNTILTLLILTKSPKQLGSYKYLMIFISLVEIVYSILDVIISPVFFSTSSVFIILSHHQDTKLISDEIIIILLTLWCAIFGLLMGTFGLHFIYRYSVVYGSNLLKTFKGYGMLFWFMIPLIYGLMWGLISYFIGKPSQVINDAVRTDILTYLDWDIDQTVYLAAYFHRKMMDGNIQTDIPSFIAIMVLIVIISSSFSAMTFCGFKCYLEINRLIITKDMRSQRFNQLQSQLFQALITETLIPVILMHFPAMLLLITTLMDNGLRSISDLITITIPLFPALDPLPTMLIIKNYRYAISNCFAGIFTFFKIRTSESRGIASTNLDIL